MRLTLLEYFENGTIKDLTDRGIIGTKYLSYFDYWKTYKYYHDQGKGYREGIALTADSHGVSYDTVRNAVRLIQSG